MADDVQREIEENERRVRDEEDVGIDQDVLQDPNDLDSDTGFLGGLFGGDDDDEGENEKTGGE